MKECEQIPAPIYGGFLVEDISKTNSEQVFFPIPSIIPIPSCIDEDQLDRENTDTDMDIHVHNNNKNMPNE